MDEQEQQVPVSRIGDLTIQYEWLDKHIGKMRIEIFWNTDFSDHEVCARFVDNGDTTANDGKSFKSREKAETYAQDLFNKYNPKAVLEVRKTEREGKLTYLIAQMELWSSERNSSDVKLLIDKGMQILGLSYADAKSRVDEMTLDGFTASVENAKQFNSNE